MPTGEMVGVTGRGVEPGCHSGPPCPCGWVVARCRAPVRASNLGSTLLPFKSCMTLLSVDRVADGTRALIERQRITKPGLHAFKNAPVAVQAVAAIVCPPSLGKQARG